MHKFEIKTALTRKQSIGYLFCFFLLAFFVYLLFQLLMKNDKLLYVSMSSVMEEISFSSGCLDMLPKSIFFMSGTDSACLFIQNLYPNDGNQIMTLLPKTPKKTLIQGRTVSEIIQNEHIELEVFSEKEKYSIYCLKNEDTLPCFILKSAQELEKSKLDDYWSGVLFFASKLDSLSSFYHCINK